ncbi:hypothetical protein GP486_002931 [Trichoglossum hirsutum]|uniref:Piwi-domain-containing protein n=1 Tax=Trichoglossum hirsutum TaxID=265104 RepID=A0A9P8LEA8_9PEZI|nr:hypothetical protein GP486_002931 [Trichoglossum hirsutum]
MPHSGVRHVFLHATAFARPPVGKRAGDPDEWRTNLCRVAVEVEEEEGATAVAEVTVVAVAVLEIVAVVVVEGMVMVVGVADVDMMVGAAGVDMMVEAVVGAAEAVEGLEIWPPEGIPPPAENVRQLEDKIIQQQKAGTSIGSLSLSDRITLPRRPGYGSTGRKIVLRTNYFQLDPRPQQTWYRYFVELQPNETVKRKRHRIFTLLLNSDRFAPHRAHVATDYAGIIVSAEKLQLGDGDRATVSIDYFDADQAGPGQNPRNYTAKIQQTGVLAVADLLQYLSSPAPNAFYDAKDEMVQALNIVMARHANANQDVVPVAGSKFFPLLGGANQHDLRGGLVALRGYYTSVRTSTLRVILNVNVCTAAFYQPGSLLDLLRRFRKQNNPKPDLPMPSVEGFVKRLRVETNHIRDEKKRPVKKVRVIAGFARKPLWGNAKAVKFDTEEYGNISVEDYFFKRYGLKLQTPEAPVVNVRSAQDPVYLPPELCTVLPGQIARRKLSDVQTAEMITVAARRPAENAKLIVGEGGGVVGLTGNTGLGAFGLRVDPKMITVDGRVLDPPTLQYQKEFTRPDNGSWNMIRKKFTAGAPVKNWTFLKLNLGRDPFYQNLPDIINSFHQMLNTCGLRADPPTPASGLNANLQEDDGQNYKILDSQFQRAKQQKLRLLLVILPTQRRETYAQIKSLADSRYGIHTVCVVADKIAKGQPQYMANVALKVNLKMGGTNQALHPTNLGTLSGGKTMVVGIDVTHPSPSSVKGAPSIAGVVASIDGSYAQWPASLRIQKGRKEMVTELTEMFVERLRLWQKKNGNALPTRILVYRDGVSEGQYSIVLNDELPLIRKACSAVYPPNGPKPKLTIVIVGKRHHTRFYPVTDEGHDGRTGNPKNGTVVDRGITMERGWDMFLQAHTGLQGTTRPAHYVVLLDEIGLGADDLEQLTHNLCYLFGRATKSVSICPPAYYADLLCERGRCYMFRALNISDAGSTTSTADSDKGFQQAQNEWGQGVHPDLKDSMFYI